MHSISISSCAGRRARIICMPLLLSCLVSSCHALALQPASVCSSPSALSHLLQFLPVIPFTSAIANNPHNGCSGVCMRLTSTAQQTHRSCRHRPKIPPTGACWRSASRLLLLWTSLIARKEGCQRCQGECLGRCGVRCSAIVER